MTVEAEIAGRKAAEAALEKAVTLLRDLANVTDQMGGYTNCSMADDDVLAAYNFLAAMEACDE